MTKRSGGDSWFQCSVAMAGHNDGIILHGVCVIGEDAAIHVKCTALPVEVGC